ncbi:MAG TPA: carboxypeptidase-like regulatory domain-containing protein, partial [Bryobacteraceae bacterium]
MKSIKLRQILTGLALALAIAGPARPQATGTVKGLILDPTGKSVPAARIRLENRGTDRQFETLTGEGGTYTFTFLDPGNYRLTASLTGFKTVIRDLIVDVAGTVTIDATLELGEATQQVSVIGETQQVETSTSSLGRVVEEKMLTAVPLSSRNFTQILALSPGVNAGVANAGALGRNSINISANGSRPFDNTVVLNGLLAENPMSQGFDDDVDKTGVPIPAPDSLMEFKVQTGLYDAEYGRQGGAVINVVTKSGTN